jgi:putative Holliday junction resolvase
MGRLVGFDYGRARIGISLSDERKIIASSLLVLKVPKTLPLLLKELEKVLAPYSPFDLFIIGLPLLLSGKEGEMAEEVKAFGKALTDHFSVPCIFWDERLSSSQADRFMREDSLSRKERAQRIDTVCSTLILQNYLEAQEIKQKKLPK